MKFYYDLRGKYDEPDRYYDEQTIRRFKVYPANRRIEAQAEQSVSWLWPVYDPYGQSNIPVECKDINEAYAYILEAENLSVYEYIHDI